MRAGMRNHDFRMHGPFEVIDSVPGRTRVAVPCPFCGGDVVGYIWSIAKEVLGA
jgi:hypothetical protein